MAIGVDNLENAAPLESFELQNGSIWSSARKGPGLTDEVVNVCEGLVADPQCRSTAPSTPALQRQSPYAPGRTLESRADPWAC